VDDDCADADEGRLGVLTFDAAVDVAVHNEVGAIRQFCHVAGGSASPPHGQGRVRGGPVSEGGPEANRLLPAIIK
jgi:hypothetical protein